MKRFSNPSNGKAAHKSSSTWKFWLKALIRVLAGSDADLAVSVPHDRPYRQLWLAAAAVGRDTCSGNLVRERKNSIDIDEESYLAAPHRDEPPTHHIKLFHPRPRSRGSPCR
ncbi:hypothetical protein BDBG_02450 [Blastomyces gilchristii SLH14081]|uniref:Uncharacterized protein n=1 Tax=Blastomyces gilchristii (strain SLH14081) TaxID=559298 RepID=A0A179UI86_BLAGS|nr:uncharacterized protein BDBG_02450 [Blastomyces gilchristii SLH14081]OAT06192.1 hypothetical protein BDBG_02450 [Blastomyces gilchristii SLH14081]